jgi:hypothetical protein
VNKYIRDIERIRAYWRVSPVVLRLLNREFAEENLILGVPHSPSKKKEIEKYKMAGPGKRGRSSISEIAISSVS